MSLTIYQIQRIVDSLTTNGSITQTTSNLIDSYIEVQDSETTGGSYRINLYNLKSNILSDISAGADNTIQYSDGGVLSGNTNFIFTNDTKTEGAFYLGSDNPNITTKRLNYDGRFHATSFHVSGNELLLFNNTNSNKFNLSFSSPTLSLSFLTGKTSGAFYTGTVDPSSTSRLNYDGNFYATNLYSLNSVYANGVELTGNLGTVTEITAGDGMDFSGITTTGSIILGRPSDINDSSTNNVSSNSHTHAIDISISKINDTDITSASNGQVLTYSGGTWINSGITLLSNISDDVDNSLLVGNATTTGNVNITAQGSDDNIDINFNTKGDQSNYFFNINDNNALHIKSNIDPITSYFQLEVGDGTTGDDVIVIRPVSNQNNVSTHIQSKGSGTWTLSKSSAGQGILQLHGFGAGYNNVIIEAGNSIETNVNLILQPKGIGTVQTSSGHTTNISLDDDVITKGYADDNYINIPETTGTTSKILYYDESLGQVTYDDAPTGGTSTSPGGIDGQLQYNNNGLFGGTGLVWDDSVNTFLWDKGGSGLSAESDKMFKFNTDISYVSDHTYMEFLSSGTSVGKIGVTNLTSGLSGEFLIEGNFTNLYLRSNYDIILEPNVSNSNDMVRVLSDLYVDENLLLPNIITGTTSKILYYNELNGQVTYDDTPTGGTSTSPGGADTTIQYNNGSVFSGNTDLTWNGELNVKSDIKLFDAVYIYNGELFNSAVWSNYIHYDNYNYIENRAFETIDYQSHFIQYAINPSYSSSAVAGDVYIGSNISGVKNSKVYDAHIESNFDYSEGTIESIIRTLDTLNNSEGKISVLSDKIEFAYGATNSPSNKVEISDNIKFNEYGLGNYTGTTTKWLAVDASGNIIEEDAPTGGTGSTTTYQSTGSTSFSTTLTTIDTYINSKDFATYFYSVSDGTNKRSGTITVNNSTSTALMNESSTGDIGDTSGVTFSVDISGGDVRLRAVATSGTWICKFIKNIM